MNTLTYIFFITLAISGFCAFMAAILYLVKEVFFRIWKVREAEANGLFWGFLRTSIKVLLSISTWLIILIGLSGILLLIILGLSLL